MVSFGQEARVRCLKTSYTLIDTMKYPFNLGFEIHGHLIFLELVLDQPFTIMEKGQFVYIFERDPKAYVDGQIQSLE